MKKCNIIWSILVLMLLIGSSLFLIGCGGGSGSVDGAASSMDGTITGTAVKGPVICILSMTGWPPQVDGSVRRL